MPFPGQHPEHQLQPGATAGLAQGMTDVGLHGADAENPALGDGFVAES